MIRRLLPAAILIVLAHGCTDAGSQAVAGRASVVDGDTIEIAGKRIRLAGIDAPESGQRCRNATGQAYRCGKAAADALDAHLGGKTVTCRPDPADPIDRYGRMVALCETSDGGVNGWLLREGHAVAFRKHLDGRAYRSAFLAAETEAKAGRRGIWAGTFDMPENWRAERRAGNPAAKD